MFRDRVAYNSHKRQIGHDLDHSDPPDPHLPLMRCCAGDLCSTGSIQKTCPRLHPDRTGPTRPHELDHTDHTDDADDTNHTDDTDQKYICRERSRSRAVVGIDHTDHTDHLSEVVECLGSALRWARFSSQKKVRSIPQKVNLTFFLYGIDHLWAYTEVMLLVVSIVVQGTTKKTSTQEARLRLACKKKIGRFPWKYEIREICMKLKKSGHDHENTKFGTFAWN